MTFSGSVINAPCSIAPDSQNIKVDLGQVPAKRLSAAGSTSDLTPVTITLTGCSFDPPPEEAQNGGVTGNLSKVAVSFPDAPAPENGDGTLVNGEIKNTEVPGGAQHVAIQLLHGDGSTPVDMSKAPEAADAKNITLNTTASTNKLNFWARMISVAG
ncbi:fimbrial protein, partial [Salmonella enterica]|nr:fimbrial protein [Salmonella enterica]